MLYKKNKCKEIIYKLIFFMYIPILLNVDIEHDQCFKKSFLKTCLLGAALQGTDMSTAS